MYDLLFYNSLATPGAEDAESVADVAAGVDQPQDKEETGNRAEHDAYDGAWLWAGVEALISRRDGKNLGLPFRKEERCRRALQWFSSGEVFEGLEGATYNGGAAGVRCEVRRDGAGYMADIFAGRSSR
jgi:hypothetical protein